ncbi:MAG TPA: F0F1 ATP synthase subunit epsilon [Propionibacteriaceae bacterium]
MAEPMQVEVVSADEVVWSGEATNIIAKTVDGDIGILANHSPVLAVLVPGGVEIVCPDGKREIVAVEGGFMSVNLGRVSILSEYAKLAREISLNEAERNLSEANSAIDAGDDSDEMRTRFLRATAQVKAAQKAG